MELQSTVDMLVNTTSGWLIIPTLWSHLWERCLEDGAFNSYSTSTVNLEWCHLAVGVNYRSQQLPGAPPAVHTQHAQDLQESQTPDGRGGEHIALRTGRQHWHGGDQHHDVWREKTHHRTLNTLGKIQIPDQTMSELPTLYCVQRGPISL